MYYAPPTPIPSPQALAEERLLGEALEDHEIREFVMRRAVQVTRVGGLPALVSLCAGPEGERWGTYNYYFILFLFPLFFPFSFTQYFVFDCPFSF